MSERENLPDLEKQKIRMSLLRAEIKYLDANGWTLYVPGVQDPETGEWKIWGEPSNPKSIIPHDDAVTRQKLIDLQKDKENADNG